jgi:hypothetical protein
MTDERLSEKELMELDELCRIAAGIHPKFIVPLINEIRALRKERDELHSFLLHEGFVQCDTACNCGSWHQTGGFKRRFDEIEDAVEEAGHDTNGKTLLMVIGEILEQNTQLKKERDELQVRVNEFEDTAREMIDSYMKNMRPYIKSLKKKVSYQKNTGIKP